MIIRMLLMFLVAVGVAGCKRAADSGGSNPDPAELSDDALRKLTEEQRLRIAEPVADIALSAYIDGRSLHIAIKNQTSKSIVVGPKNVAVLLPGGKIATFKPRESGFPVAKLLPGDRVEGLLPLHGIEPSELSGARLMFRHPEVKDATTPVRASATEPLKTPPVPVTPARKS